MFRLFKKNNNNLLGIDIGSTAIKLIELSYRSNSYCVEAYESISIPDGAIVDNMIKDAASLGETIKKIRKRSGTKQKKVAIAVSGTAVITKVIDMNSSLSDSEMEAQIAIEAERYIPYPLDEVAIDFEVQSLNPKNPELAGVLLSACRRDHIEILEETLDIGGFEAVIIDVETFAIERSFELLQSQMTFNVEHSTIGMINIGASTTSLYVLHAGKIIYTREQSLGGQQLTQNIQHHYEMDVIQAEKIKKADSFPQDYEEQILNPFRSSLVQQISRALQFFYSSSEHIQVDAVVLTGGSALISNLVEAVKKELAIDTYIANPFADMIISRKINKKLLAREAPALMIACGLAMRSFD